jgi:hypothetical protein
LALVTFVEEQGLCQARSVLQKPMKGLEITGHFLLCTEQRDPSERFRGAAIVLECATLSQFNQQTIASASAINGLLSTA